MAWKKLFKIVNFHFIKPSQYKQNPILEVFIVALRSSSWKIIITHYSLKGEFIAVQKLPVIATGKAISHWQTKRFLQQHFDETSFDPWNSWQLNHFISFLLFTILLISLTCNFEERKKNSSEYNAVFKTYLHTKPKWAWAHNLAMRYHF